MTAQVYLFLNSTVKLTKCRKVRKLGIMRCCEIKCRKVRKLWILVICEIKCCKVRKLGIIVSLSICRRRFKVVKYERAGCTILINKCQVSLVRIVGHSWALVRCRLHHPRWRPWRPWGVERQATVFLSWCAFCATWYDSWSQKCFARRRDPWGIWELRHLVHPRYRP